MFINYIVILYICTHIIYPCPSKLLHHIHPTSPSAGRRALEGKGGLAADVLSKQLGGNRAVLLKPRWNRDASRSLASKNTHYLYITIYFKGEIIGNAHLMYIYVYIYTHILYIFIYIFFGRWLFESTPNLEELGIWFMALGLQHSGIKGGYCGSQSLLLEWSNPQGRTLIELTQTPCYSFVTKQPKSTFGWLLAKEGCCTSNVEDMPASWSCGCNLVLSWMHFTLNIAGRLQTAKHDPISRRIRAANQWFRCSRFSNQRTITVDMSWYVSKFRFWTSWHCLLSDSPFWLRSTTPEPWGLGHNKKTSRGSSNNPRWFQ
jgi:hypothetical protein